MARSIAPIKLAGNRSGTPMYSAQCWAHSEAHPELAIIEEYSSDASPCERCREHGPFRPAPSGRIVEILGYC